MADPEIITFGCRLNTYESEVMREHARDTGLSNTIIVNSVRPAKRSGAPAAAAPMPGSS